MKLGDIVQLKSGGPKMTVDCIVVDSDGFAVRVVWFNSKGEYCVASYGAASLTTDLRPWNVEHQ